MTPACLTTHLLPDPVADPSPVRLPARCRPIACPTTCPLPTHHLPEYPPVADPSPVRLPACCQPIACPTTRLLPTHRLSDYPPVADPPPNELANMYPADTEAFHRAISHQQAQLGQHDQALQEITSSLPVPVPSPPVSFREPFIPAPEPYGGDLGQCRSFLLQCSLVFELQPQTYATDKARIAYLIGSLRGEALTWATAVWERGSAACSDYSMFTEEMRRVFDHPNESTKDELQSIFAKMDNFAVLGLLGEGSFGTVMKCRNNTNGQLFAVKKFFPLNRQQMNKAIDTEFRLLSGLQHDNLIKVLSTFIEKGLLHCVGAHGPQQP
ncbi:Cyclin-dependent kinase-like 3 [Merluccius polli]|uniref:Cyclin-dependent kinase-like 3 n=1 Tax=Merluccius polli TaxID=89951 RepID=A0AA47NPQ4_MERPO|nr:Cyclin-dependent kinase-like 3 [Merluccius polli]